MNLEIVENACQQYNMVLLPGETMTTEITSPNRARCQKTTFEKHKDSTMNITFEKPDSETVRFTYPPLKESITGF